MLHEKSATELSRRIASRDVSAEEVTRAHLDHIASIEPRVHAFTMVLRHEALAAARRADEELRRGESRGPLHGVPITVKESLDFEGHASTLGIEKRRKLIAKSDAVIVRAAREAGAVILGRTNVSQLLLFHESRNPIFGQTVNPWSFAHSPGGSSGGESAAIASGMSPLGIGTDIGGSIRVPAHFCGISGLKPTLDRWSNTGSNTAMVGQEGIRSQLGPMARTAEDVALFFSSLDVTRMSALDGRVPPLAYVDPHAVDLSKLTVGVIGDEAFVPCSRAVARAVALAGDTLRSACKAVVPFNPPGLRELIFDYFAAMSADGGRTALEAVEGTPVDVAIKSLVQMAKMPHSVRRMAARAARLAGQERLASLLDVIGEKTVSELWRLTARLRAARATLLDAMAAARIDLLVCATHSTPAMPHTLSRDFALAGAQSMLFNLTQLPAGVSPITRVRADETDRNASRDRLEKRAKEVDGASVGLPVGVQIVGRPWKEHEVLAAMMHLDRELTATGDRPITPVPLRG
jgi:fatty acid amide hydrolase